MHPRTPPGGRYKDAWVCVLLLASCGLAWASTSNTPNGLRNPEYWLVEQAALGAVLAVVAGLSLSLFRRGSERAREPALLILIVCLLGISLIAAAMNNHRLRGW